MKIISILMILAALAVHPSQAQQQAKAKELLKKLSENNKSYESIRAGFTFRYKSLQSKAESSWDGKILMKGKKYRLELRQSTVYYNGKTLWNHLHDAQEVNVSEPVQQDQSDILNHPHQIFEIHQMDLKYQYLGEETINGEDIYKVDLFPRELDRDYSRIRLFLHQSPVQIHSAKVFGKDGTRYTIEIEDLVTNQPVADSTFVFDKADHPNVEVIDMRF